MNLQGGHITGKASPLRRQIQSPDLRNQTSGALIPHPDLSGTFIMKYMRALPKSLFVGVTSLFL